MVQLDKLKTYCLAPAHPVGGHKARVFASALGLTQAHAEELRNALLAAARDGEAVFTQETHFGTRYRLDFLMAREGKTAQIRSLWVIDRPGLPPRLTSCYVNL